MPATNHALFFLPLYTKAFVKGARPRYAWVNFDMDTIRMSQFDVEFLGGAKEDSIRWLTVTATNRDAEWFFYHK